MHFDPLQVLLVEDNDDHARLIEHRLGQIRPSPKEVRRSTRLADAILAVQSSTFDVILLDLRLPDSVVQETLPRMIAAAPDLPIIVLTSLEDFDLAVELIKQGAQDYIVKSNLNLELLSRSIYYAIERKRSQVELRHYAGELERVNRELDQFTRVVSHDLKSPLTVLQMALSMLEDNCEDHSPEVADRLRGAIETTQQMHHLIDDLLRYARTSEGETEYEQVDIDELVRSILTELAPAIEQVDGSVTVDPLPRMRGNPTRLRQLFQNLITNALNYHGNKPPAVHVSAEFIGPDWVFSVADQGIGIPPEESERVFDMFTRLRDHEVPGSGVGLAICKRVVSLHGGRIWLESKPGHGTTFYFNLPAGQPQANITSPPHVGSDAPPDERSSKGNQLA